MIMVIAATAKYTVHSYSYQKIMYVTLTHVQKDILCPTEFQIPVKK